MNIYRYITVLLFSLLIIFAGVGIAVIHCYCVSCRVTHECCDTNHEHQSQSVHHYDSSSYMDYSSQEDCCASTVYKIDLLKGANPKPIVAPLVLQLCKDMVLQLMPPPVAVLQTSDYIYPPLPPESRRYLALYSTFII